MEFELGITDNRPSDWEKAEPLWQDEKIVATSSHSFFDLMHKLCENAIKLRREHEDDYGIDTHLWKLEIMSFRQATSPGSQEELFLNRFAFGGGEDSDTESDEEDEDNESDAEEESYRRKILIEKLQEDEFFDEELYERVSPNEKMSTENLPQNSVIEVTYDYGSTTTLYLKVLKARRTAVRALLEYFNLESSENMSASKQQKELMDVPAYALPKEQQIDSFFPHISKIFIGKYVPVLALKENEDVRFGDAHGSCENRISCASLGKYACIRSEGDTPFSFISGRTDSDVMFCPVVLEPNEFLQVSELAWTPRDPKDDKDNLDGYRFEGMIRFLAPSDNDEVYDTLNKTRQEEMAEGGFFYGPYQLIHRLPPSYSKKLKSFDFQKIFPKTYAMLTNGKFRWFLYKKGVLRIIAGRGIGPMNRDFGSEQILKTWKYDFQSFHELLCAVEASWVWKGKELKADVCLPMIDDDLSPSDPGPTQPFSLGKEEDCVVVSHSSESKTMVSALAITEEIDKDDQAKAMLYSGHDDGTLSKWSLDDNIQLWSKQIYADGRETLKDFTCHMGDATFGVAGIVVRPGQSDGPCIYTWTHAYEGFPDKDFDRRDASKVKCWSKDGSLIRSYSCDVGNDDSGVKAHPSIGAVVFCELYVEYKDRWVDAMVVGLHCGVNSFQWKDDYSDFDLGLAQEGGEGNILPFYEHTGGRMESWRESSELIQSLAVVPRKYVASFSIRLGHGRPDALILWSCDDPGVPVCRYDFWKPSRNIFKESKTRLHAVTGMSVCGDDILMVDDYSDRIAAVRVENSDDSNGGPTIKIVGYAKIGKKYYEGEDFHGRSTMSGPLNIITNAGFPDVWVFKTQQCWNHPKLDKGDGNRRNFPAIDHDDPRSYAARDMAVGHYQFPKWGGNESGRKKRKKERTDQIFLPGMISNNYDEYEKSDYDDKGGPMVLAVRGKWLVAGFSNGTIARAPHLPSEFAFFDDSSSSSHIPSDEWPIPVLEFDGQNY